WWEHCFAVAYWLNVRNGYGVTHFEVLNEPDFNCQGWCNNSCSGFSADFCGTEAEYVQLVLDAFDAVSYANGLVALDAYVHAPVVAGYASSYVASALAGADAAIQVVDYHTYDADPRSTITAIRGTVSSQNPDGIVEPLWISEWGALWTSYDTMARAMLTANQLLTFCEEGVQGVTIFNMYDWSTAAGQDFGLVDLQDDGGGGAARAYTETYFAYRLMIRGLSGGKQILQTGVATGVVKGPGPRVMATRDDDFVALSVVDGNGSVLVDVASVTAFSGVAAVYEYSATNKDVVVSSPVVTDGKLTFAAPATGLSLVRVPQIPIAVELMSFTID
ncbi:MAG: hypothetical protein GY778_19070, partial [bacterium]|nr:hypothetical protein [bacterium]